MTPYESVALATTYHTAMGNAAKWGVDTTLQGAALLRASVSMDNTYRSRLPGTKTGGRAQEREWPRTDAYDSSGVAFDDDEIPQDYLYAVYEGALRELQSPGAMAPDYDGSKKVKSERKKVGQLEKDIEYFESDSSSATYAAIDGYLSSILLPPVNTKTGFVYLKRA